MSLGALKFFRLIIPGVLTLLFVTPLSMQTWDTNAFLEILQSAQALLDSGIAVVVGALYYTYRLRRFAWGKSLESVNNNIKNTLLNTCSDEPSVLEAAERLRQGRTLMNVFYQFIDRDPSLEEKANRVRFNGLIWTSAADLATVATIAIPFYLAVYLITGRTHVLIILLALPVIAVVARYVLMPPLTRSHLDLSNDQLEYMADACRQELCAELEKRAQRV